MVFVLLILTLLELGTAIPVSTVPGNNSAEVRTTLVPPQLFDDDTYVVDSRLADQGLDMYMDDDGSQASDRKARSTMSSMLTVSALMYTQLFCRSGYHLQILPDGNISGTPESDNDDAIVQIISIHPPSTIAIKGVNSGLYLAMNKRGDLYASRELTKDCHFIENIIENLYNTYQSQRHPRSKNKRRDRKKKKENRRKKERRKSKNKRESERRTERKNRPWFVAFDVQGRPRNGSRVRAIQKMTHFLPRPINPAKIQSLYPFLVGNS